MKEEKLRAGMRKKIDKKVYTLLRQIPKGRVVTYKTLAHAAGSSQGWRWIGTIVGKNPDLVKTPCHRVVRSDGTVGGYAQGTTEKVALLRKEGILIQGKRIQNFKNINFKFV